MGSKVKITETFTGGARMQISYFFVQLWLRG